MRIGIVLLLVLCSAGVAARESAPRVLSPHNADAYSMKTFALFPRWRDLKGDAKVYEVYKYLADKRTGIFPMGAGAWEGKDVVYEFGYIRDPVKMINVYTLGYCDMLGPTMAGVMHDMGIGPSRTADLPECHHVTAEVFYGDKWHYLDLDLRLIFRRPDGTLASLEEARQDASLWKGPESPICLPIGKLDKTRGSYLKSSVEYRHGVNMGGHTMDFVLRRGETLTRWWKPQGERWNHHESYHTPPAIRAILDRPPRGPKCKHAGDVFTIHANGNGRFVYKPNLTGKSIDFADGVYDSSNVQPGASGLTLKTAGEGYAIFEVRSPYVIVPTVNKVETVDDDREASVAKLDAAGVSAALSLDNGLTWKELPAGAELDLTAHVSGAYGYLLKLILKGEPEKALVKGLEITTWVQLHPAALPSLRKGKNEMQFVTGDHHGLQTRVMEIRTNGNVREEFLKYLHEPPKDFDSARFKMRAAGPFIAKVQAPPGTKIAWFSGGGNFGTEQKEEAAKTKSSMAYAADAPADFKEFYKSEVPTNNDHWHYNADVEVKLEKPAKTVFIRYIGDPGINNLRIYAHCLDDQPPAHAPVTIRHAWSENGAAKSKTVTLDKPGPYEIVTESEPIDESIEMSIPSSAK